jgi:hypothetical protein
VLLVSDKKHKAPLEDFFLWVANACACWIAREHLELLCLCPAAETCGFIALGKAWAWDVFKRFPENSNVQTSLETTGFLKRIKKGTGKKQTKNQPNSSIETQLT